MTQRRKLHSKYTDIKVKVYKWIYGSLFVLMLGIVLLFNFKYSWTVGTILLPIH